MEFEQAARLTFAEECLIESDLELRWCLGKLVPCAAFHYILQANDDWHDEISYALSRLGIWNQSTYVS